MPFKYLSFFVYLFSALLFSACGPSSKHPKNTLRICFANDPTTIDPKRSGDFISSTLICILYEGLTRCKSGTEVELALAEKIDISPDGKTYIFSLRKSFWTDGRPVTANDFEQSWKKTLNPAFPAPCAYLLYPIKNAELYAKGLCYVEEVGIHSLDAHTLKVELENPTSYFLSLTAFPTYRPTPDHVEKPMSCWGKEETLSSIVCNGPFCLKKVSPSEEIVLKKNSKFWNPNKIHLNQIHISIIPDEVTALHLFEKGDLDLVGGPLNPLTTETLPNLEKEFPLYFLPMEASTFCTFNTEVFPFSNQTLRKAFAKAIQDHPYIVGEIEQNGHVPASRLLPPSLQYKEISSESPPTKGARDFLKIALEELQINPEKLQELTLYYKTNPIDKKIAQTLQKIWEETLGISIQIEQIDPKSLSQKLYTRNYQLALTYLIAQFHDPISILERFKDKKNPKNYPGWSHKGYGELLSQASSSIDDSERSQLLHKAEEILEDSTLFIPLYHWKSPILIHDRVKGLETTSSGGILIEGCSVDLFRN